jgi:branched-chain amino acid aminotransferase
LNDAHPVVWVNGQRLAPDAPQVSARDRGFTLADGLFETMLLHNGKVFRLEPHLARLRAGLRVLAIPEPPDVRVWVDAAVQAAWVEHGVVRLTVTRGIGPGGLIPPLDPRPTVVLIVTPSPPPDRTVYEQGLSVHVASGRRNEHAATAGLKTIAFTDGIAATIEAQRAGADEALLLDVAGHCCEAAASNLFAVSGGTVRTPPLTCGPLAGITRAAVLELAATCGIRAEERIVVPDELAAADEAFLTSSFRGIAPLVRMDGSDIGGGEPGPLTRRLMAAYASLVQTECGGGA